MDQHSLQFYSRKRSGEVQAKCRMEPWPFIMTIFSRLLLLKYISVVFSVL